MSYNEKQEQIIIAAEQLFAEKGFAGTSVRDIAQIAKVNVAMISYYFGSKEKLLAAIFQYRINATALHIESIIADDKVEPIQKIYGLIDHYTDKLFNNTCFHNLMLREQLMRDNNDELKEAIYESKARNYGLISQIIAEGQKKGKFKKKIDISLMVSTMVGTANQIVFNQNFYKRMNGYSDMPEEAFQVMLKKKIKQHLKIMFKAVLTYDN